MVIFTKSSSFHLCDFQPVHRIFPSLFSFSVYYPNFHEGQAKEFREGKGQQVLVFLTLQRITQTRTQHLWYIQITNIFPSHYCYSSEACLWCFWWCLNYQKTQPNQTWHWVYDAIYTISHSDSIKLMSKPHDHSHSCLLTFSIFRLFITRLFFYKTQFNPFSHKFHSRPGKKVNWLSFSFVRRPGYPYVYVVVHVILPPHCLPIPSLCSSRIKA